MTNPYRLLIIILLFILPQGCKIRSYVFETEIAGSACEVVISSKRTPEKTDEKTFYIHPDDYIMVHHLCGYEDFKAILVKGESTLGLSEEWGIPYTTRNRSIYFHVRDFACPRPYSSDVYHWADRFYLQIIRCPDNPELDRKGLVFNVSRKIAFCK